MAPRACGAGAGARASSSSSSSFSATTSGGGGAARIPSVAYHMLKDKDIRERLSKFGLPTSGPKDAIVD